MAAQESSVLSVSLEATLSQVLEKKERSIHHEVARLSQMLTANSHDMVTIHQNVNIVQSSLQHQVNLMDVLSEKTCEQYHQLFEMAYSRCTNSISKFQVKIRDLKTATVKAMKTQEFEPIGMMEIDNATLKAEQDCKNAKAACHKIHECVTELKHAYKELSKQIKRDNEILLEKKAQTNLLDVTVQRMGADYEAAAETLADTKSTVLDESFGPYYREIEVILVEFEWDFSKFESLVRDRDAFLRRIAQVQEDVSGKERTRQHNIMANQRADLKKEHDHLHQLRFHLKNELISAERDLELAAGVQHFHYQPPSPVSMDSSYSSD